jgi:hypothetical protein
MQHTLPTGLDAMMRETWSSYVSDATMRTMQGASTFSHCG